VCPSQLQLSVPADHFQINQGLTGPTRDILATYWQNTINHLETDFNIDIVPREEGSSIYTERTGCQKSVAAAVAAAVAGAQTQKALGTARP
jgi:hypothetical protein